MIWNDATANPLMNWDKRLDLFQVAMVANHSISTTKLTREAAQQNPGVRSLIQDLDEDPANERVISVMYLSLREAARKQAHGQISNYGILGLESTTANHSMT